MFFNVWSNKIYFFNFIFYIVLLFISLFLISYLLIKALEKYLEYKICKNRIFNYIKELNKNNYKAVLKNLNLNSSYKLKLIGINPDKLNKLDPKELRDLLLIYYLGKKD